jgi:Fibronectin type III domain/Repeat of unknown function (DUF5648)
MRVRSVFLTLLVLTLGALHSPLRVSADGYSLAAVPLYECIWGVVTASVEEKITLEQQGVPCRTLCYVSPAQIPGTVPLLRLYNHEINDHLYTLPGTEQQEVIAKGFVAEGILGYVFPKGAQPPGTVPLHRFYLTFSDGSTATHDLETDEKMFNRFSDVSYEGISCYVWPGPKQIATMTISRPRPGEQLQGGSEYEVLWSASSKIGYISIGYSADAGYSWRFTDVGLENKGFAKWRIPNVDTTHARIQLVWTDARSGATNLLAIAESSSDLRIKKRPMMLPHGVTARVAMASASPSGLTAKATSASEIRLTWQAVKGSPEGYLLERRTGKAPFRVIANVLAPVVTYADTHISPGTSYEYRVRAYGGGSSSDYGNLAAVKTAFAVRAMDARGKLRTRPAPPAEGRVTPK